MGQFLSDFIGDLFSNIKLNHKLAFQRWPPSEMTCLIGSFGGTNQSASKTHINVFLTSKVNYIPIDKYVVEAMTSLNIQDQQA